MSIASKILEVLGESRFPPSPAPEWGSGGVFGMKYHRRHLLFTLAFEARTYVASSGGDRLVYDFALVGEGRERSGGDTYNATEAVDDRIFFAGWVHAPPRFRQEPGRGREIDFTHKYSHVHYYDISNMRFVNVWSEGLGHPRYWAGEVSEIIYDPLVDRLLLARGDGHERLGVYSINPWKQGGAEQVSPHPVLKGTRFLDHACFSHHGPGDWHPFRGYTCVELGTGKRSELWADPQRIESPDGGGVLHPRVGSVASAYTRLYAFVRGGLIVGDPVSEDERGELVFYRLLDFHPSHYGPLRVNSVMVGAGILTSWNTMSHATVVGTDESSGEIMAASRLSPAPSLLIYITEPQPRIVGAWGARVTSLEALGDSIVLGWSTFPNLERYDATRLDAGVRGLDALPLGDLMRGPPSVSIRVPHSTLTGGGVWGGIPLAGYGAPRLVIASLGGARLRVYTYLLGDREAEVDTYRIGPGVSSIDLGAHGWGVVSFHVMEGRVDRAVIHLR